MNIDSPGVSRWAGDSIERRAAALAEAALTIWPYFGPESEESRAGPDPREKPRKLIFLGESFDVESWRDVLEQTLNVIEEREDERFQQMVEAMPRLLGPDPSAFLSSRPLRCGTFGNVHFSAKDINRFCLRALEAAGIGLAEWTVEME